MEPDGGPPILGQDSYNQPVFSDFVTIKVQVQSWVQSPRSKTKLSTLTSIGRGVTLICYQALWLKFKKSVSQFFLFRIVTKSSLTLVADYKLSVMDHTIYYNILIHFSLSAIKSIPRIVPEQYIFNLHHVATNWALLVNHPGMENISKNN